MRPPTRSQLLGIRAGLAAGGLVGAVGAIVLGRWAWLVFVLGSVGAVVGYWVARPGPGHRN